MSKVIFVEQMLTGPALFTGKAALLLLYYRIFSLHLSFRWQIYVTIAIAFVANIAMIPMNAVLCLPPRGHWGAINPNCIKIYSYGLVHGTVNVVTDLVAFSLPIPMVLKLHMPLRQKLGILAIFATGLL